MIGLSSAPAVCLLLQDASTIQPFSSWLGSIDEADILVTATDSMDMPLLPTTPLEASTIATSDSPFDGADSTLAAASAKQQVQPAETDAAQAQAEAAGVEGTVQQAETADADVGAAAVLPGPSSLSQQPSQTQRIPAQEDSFGEGSNSSDDRSEQSSSASMKDHPGSSVSKQDVPSTNQSSQTNASMNGSTQAASTSRALQSPQVSFCKHICMATNAHTEPMLDWQQMLRWKDLATILCTFLSLC